MVHAEVLNVFSGAESVAQYFDPDNLPLLPLIEIPSKLNPLRKQNVRIYAKMLTAHPAQNVKALPALNMLRHEPSAASKSIVEASSGSTVLSMSMAARAVYGNEDITAFVTNKKHPDQLKMLRFFGLKVALYGGLAQQEPHDPNGIMSRLRRLAKIDEGICYLGQYDNDNNWKSHEQWTGAQIFKQMPSINVLCTTVGTGGCITGTGVYLKALKPSVKVIGVCNRFGDPTPGPRHFPGFESSVFPWRDAIDEFEHISSVDSFRTSMHLCREGLIAGPSSGEALSGLLQHLQRLSEEGTLSTLADPVTGEITCVFICCDLPYQYMDLYFAKLDEAEFPPIINKVLLSCDQNHYSEKWVLTPKQASKLLLVSKQRKQQIRACKRSPASGTCKPIARARCNATIIDLRQRKDFKAEHISGSLNIPLKNLTPVTTDIFGNPNTISILCQDLKTAFEDCTMLLSSKKRHIVVLCYNGEAAQMATAMLRARDFTAFSVEGGYPALKSTKPKV